MPLTALTKGGMPVLASKRTQPPSEECGSREGLRYREGPGRSLASLMRLQEAAPGMPSVVSRSAEARTGAAAVIAAGWSGGAMLNLRI